MNLRKFLSFLFLLGVMGSSAFSNNWKLEERDFESHKYYKIIQAPEKYKVFIGTFVYSYKSNNDYKNLFVIPCKDRMLSYLEMENFEIRKHDGIVNIFLPIDFLKHEFEITKEEVISHPEYTSSKLKNLKG